MTQRIRHVSYEEAGPELRAIYDDIMQVVGVPFVLNWFKSQGANPAVLRGNWAKIKSTLFSGTIPPLLKRLIIYNISRTRGCKYCTFMHAVAANSLGAELCADEGFQVTDNLDSEHIPSSYKTAIRIVTRCALNPGSMTGDDFDDLRDEGFTDAEIQELIAQADLTTMLNTISDISGIEIDSEFLGMGSSA